MVVCRVKERSVNSDCCGNGSGAGCGGTWLCTTEVNCWAWLWREYGWWCGVLWGSLGSRSGSLGREGLALGLDAGTGASCLCRAISSRFCRAMPAAWCSASFLDGQVFETNLRGGRGELGLCCTSLPCTTLQTIGWSPCLAVVQL